MAEQSIWSNNFPGDPGYYWADDGRSITMVFAEFNSGNWLVWDPQDGTGNIPVHHYVKWSGPLMAPLPDDDDTE